MSNTATATIPVGRVYHSIRYAGEDLSPQEFADRANVEVKIGDELFLPRTRPACCYCGGAHSADNCPTTYTPINDCEHKDEIDGCCAHPKNMTPECHVGACPRLHRRIYAAWNASLPNPESTGAARPV